MAPDYLRGKAKYLFLLGGVWGTVSTIQLVLIPSDPDNAWIAGLSLSRLILILGMLAVSAAAWWGYSLARKDHPLFEKLYAWTIERYGWVLGFFFTFLLVTYTLLMLPAENLKTFQYAYQRLLPILQWGCGVSLAWVVWLAAHKLKPGVRQRMMASLSGNKNTIGWSAGMAIFLLAFTVLTGLGITPEDIGWYEAGIPILTWQFQLVLLLVVILWGLLQEKLHRDDARLDGVIFVLLWVLTAVIWLQVTPAPNYFEEYDPAAQRMIPYSDARRYAVGAQNLLAGEPFSLTEDKPIYLLFLAGIQAFTGTDYTQTAAVQSALLAVLPGLLYLLGKMLYRREAGLFAAGLAIFQQVNAFHLAQDLNLSHSKLLMTEYFTGVLLALVCVVAVKWLRTESRPAALVLMLGGLSGVAALSRLNAYIAIPLVAVFILLADWKRKARKRALLHLGTFILGVFLVLFPWNYYTTTQLGMPYSIRKVLTTLETRHNIDFLEEDGLLFHAQVASLETNSLPISLEEETERTFSPWITFKHFVHNEVMTLFVLPLTVSFENLDYYSDHPLWSPEQPWQGALSVVEWGLASLNLLLVLGGIVVAFRHAHWAGVVPFGMHLAYHYANGFATKSGGRYLVPVDWGLYLYYAVMAIALLSWGMKMLFGVRTPPAAQRATNRQNPVMGKIWFAGAFLACVLAGMSILLVTWGEESNFKAYSAKEIYSQFQTDAGFSAQFPTVEDVQQRIDSEDGVALSGKVIYPQYKEALVKNPQGRSTIRGNFPQISFSFISPFPSLGVLPVSSPDALGSFPDEAEVIVVGCTRYWGGEVVYVEALGVLENGEVTQVFSLPEDVKSICD